MLLPLGAPVLYHLPVGHGRSIATIPLGARARLGASARTLTVLDPVAR